MTINSYATFHDLWIQIWFHVYEENCEIMPEIIDTKVPNEDKVDHIGDVHQSRKMNNKKK